MSDGEDVLGTGMEHENPQHTDPAMHSTSQPRRGALGEGPSGSPGIDFELVAAHLKPLASPVRLKILDLLTRPRYLEEMAQHLGISRQAVRKHLDRLLELGVVVSRPAAPGSSHTSEFILNRLRIFQVQAEFQRLGQLKAEVDEQESGSTMERATSVAPRRAIQDEPRIVMVRGLDEGYTHRLARQPGRIWRIGRAPTMEIPISYDPYASGEHAEIRCDSEGFVLVDRFSRNGTMVNGRTLLRGGEVRLTPGDIIGTGKSKFVYQEPRPADDE